jgi:AraC-like DNA-binding protein
MAGSAPPRRRAEHYSAQDVSLGWASVWTALRLIGTEPWPRLAAELRRLAERNEDCECLPRWVELYLRRRFPQVCHLDNVAREAGTSPRVMTKTFRREYRCTVHQFVSALRLRAAIRLLRARPGITVSSLGVEAPARQGARSAHTGRM